MSARLRAFTPIDRLQTQTAGFLGTVCPGDPPIVGDAAVLIEVAPAFAIDVALDAALKATRVVPGLFLVEREFGMVQLHHRSQAEVNAAADAALGALGLRPEDRVPPRLVTHERITGTAAHHAQLLNRLRHGDLHAPGRSLLLLEVEPAGYALAMANEAEKAAELDVLEIVAFGAFGRLWLGGGDAELREAAARVEAALTAR